MCLPFIKFLTCTISYFIFVLLVVISSLMCPEQQKGRLRFSTIFPEYAAIFGNYSHLQSNHEYKYIFPTPDFYIREHDYEILDFVICIWLLGMEIFIFFVGFDF